APTPRPGRRARTRRALCARREAPRSRRRLAADGDQEPFFAASPVPVGAGAGAGLLKSTVGGALIAFSFSTEKLGFTSILNSIAVRLVGNDRTVTLYSCTALM